MSLDVWLLSQKGTKLFSTKKTLAIQIFKISMQLMILKVKLSKLQSWCPLQPISHVSCYAQGLLTCLVVPLKLSLWVGLGFTMQLNLDRTEFSTQLNAVYQGENGSGLRCGVAAFQFIKSGYPDPQHPWKPSLVLCLWGSFIQLVLWDVPKPWQR